MKLKVDAELKNILDGGNLTDSNVSADSLLTVMAQAVQAPDKKGTNKILMTMLKNIKHGNVLTLNKAIAVALLSSQDSGRDKLKIFKMATFFNSANNEVMLKSEDVVFIKDILNKDSAWSNIVTGQALSLIEEAENS